MQLPGTPCKLAFPLGHRARVFKHKQMSEYALQIRRVCRGPRASPRRMRIPLVGVAPGCWDILLLFFFRGISAWQRDGLPSRPEAVRARKAARGKIAWPMFIKNEADTCGPPANERKRTNAISKSRKQKYVRERARERKQQRRK